MEIYENEFFFENDHSSMAVLFTCFFITKMIGYYQKK